MNPNKFSKNLAYSSENGKYSAFNFTDGSTNFDRFESRDESICLLPFFKNEHDKISSLVLANCVDHVAEGKNFLTCITQSHDQNKFNSYHLSFKESIEHNLSLKEVDVNDIFYLGEISFTIPVSKKYRCFAVNLSNHYDNFSELDQSALIHRNPKIVDLKNIKFSSVVNGNVDDALCLACSMLLLSYFS
jgi:hypothetical protein